MLEENDHDDDDRDNVEYFLAIYRRDVLLAHCPLYAAEERGANIRVTDSLLYVDPEAASIYNHARHKVKEEKSCKCRRRLCKNAEYD